MKIRMRADFERMRLIRQLRRERGDLLDRHLPGFSNAPEGKDELLARLASLSTIIDAAEAYGPIHRLKALLLGVLLLVSFLGAAFFLVGRVGSTPVGMSLQASSVTFVPGSAGTFELESLFNRPLLLTGLEIAGGAGHKQNGRNSNQSPEAIFGSESPGTVRTLKKFSVGECVVLRLAWEEPERLRIDLWPRPEHRCEKYQVELVVDSKSPHSDFGDSQSIDIPRWAALSMTVQATGELLRPAGVPLSQFRAEEQYPGAPPRSTLENGTLVMWELSRQPLALTHLDILRLRASDKTEFRMTSLRLKTNALSVSGQGTVTAISRGIDERISLMPTWHEWQESKPWVVAYIVLVATIYSAARRWLGI